MFWVESRCRSLNIPPYDEVKEKLRVTFNLTSFIWLLIVDVSYCIQIANFSGSDKQTDTEVLQFWKTFVSV